MAVVDTASAYSKRVRAMEKDPRTLTDELTTAKAEEKRLWDAANESGKQYAARWGRLYEDHIRNLKAG